ncbi:hypothetical protein BO71DRAFT_401796 [Aspergillus ellipticus CBS 707.79]|uniref:C2H2-type domain-containing protein n=1 Tax=Aspergillus ellipticus CBS 707.79 TaxID=1448320 RepID=A0A319D127_9EURO|nr:hypothetical protein BO71DRAFT_401796 [Aspergillus ellipticus CBS 707.79]
MASRNSNLSAHFHADAQSFSEYHPMPHMGLNYTSIPSTPTDTFYPVDPALLYNTHTHAPPGHSHNHPPVPGIQAPGPFTTLNFFPSRPTLTPTLTPTLEYPPSPPTPVPGPGMPPKDPMHPPYPNPISTTTSTLEETPQSPNQNDENEQAQLKCEWKNCKYTHTFNRPAELLRHVKTIHISPQSHMCRYRGCSRTFNRKDKLGEHMLRAHYLPRVYQG